MKIVQTSLIVDLTNDADDDFIPNVTNDSVPASTPKMIPVQIISINDNAPLPNVSAPALLDLLSAAVTPITSKYVPKDEYEKLKKELDDLKEKLKTMEEENQKVFGIQQ